MLRLLTDFHKYTKLKYTSSLRLLTDTFPSCKDGNYECFVLDGAGFLVMHKDFLSSDIKAKDLEYVHITAKEKEIAEDLLQKGHLVKKKCRNLEKIRTENFYELNVPFRGLNKLTTWQRCRQYQLVKVAGSNAFLGEISLKNKVILGKIFILTPPDIRS